TGGTYDWTEEEQGRVLCFFYIGYLITHIPAGIVADRYEGKWILLIGVFISAVSTICSPLSIYYTGHEGLSILRIFMGLGQGTIFPALTVLLAHWIPKRERAAIGALVLGSGQMGTIISFSGSGILLEQYPWSYVFYMFGGLALLGILCNGPVWAAIAAQIGHDFGYYILVTDLPKYFHDVLNINTKENGFWASLPYLAMWVCVIAVAAIGPSILFVLASYAGCDKLLVISALTVSMFLMGPFFSGTKLNPMDLSPNYSGFQMALGNGLGALTGVIGPYLVGAMTPDGKLTQWRRVFWISFVVLNTSATIFFNWGSAEIQEFNDPVTYYNRRNAKKEEKRLAKEG
ncbi:sialin-like, partial [Glossina fuscipes]|uniref:Sialin-like n=1 Tax=Glossina fuscipes TaxID=7396 RepID=A0A9C5ZLH9_9MUSC